ncbi:hypothetical protein [Mesorhizobium abyssinicae]|uniref:hypothetical protein n=1 Tax=Mesorhizobium abyssinicae TaxID=1209958 RepID=UPI0033915693
MSVMNIYENALLGSLVRYLDPSTQPPTDNEEAFAAWKKRNGVGWLVRRSPPRPDMTWSSSGTITLQQGGFPMDLDATIAARQDFSLDSDLSFHVIEQPLPGSVRILQVYGTNSILIYLAENWENAEIWLEESRHINVRLEEIGVDEICADFVEGRAAQGTTRHLCIPPRPAGKARVRSDGEEGWAGERGEAGR